MGVRGSFLWLGLVAWVGLGCAADPRMGGGPEPGANGDAGPPVSRDAGPGGPEESDDAGSGDSGAADAGALDGGASGAADAATGEAGSVDAGGGTTHPPDAAPSDPADGGAADAGAADGGPGDARPDDGDGGSSDGGFTDGGSTDGGSADGGSIDAGLPDAGPANPTGGCVSGASGTHVVRFRWNGSTSGSTAWVSYEANTLPDTSRWRVGAYSRSIGYTPVFRDPYLGEGGLELSGTVFIDVELSTLGLGPVRQATLAIYGRSYHTSASGSFQWMTFSGSGASPYAGVANSAPYEWYRADATAALPAGDDGTLLRIEAAGPSDALIVNRVEICFDAP